MGGQEADAIAGPWEVAVVMAGGDTQITGRFQFFLADQRWVWSDALARMHGYQPGQVQPTTELMLSHKHPDDRATVAEILHRVHEGGLFSSRHRMIDANGTTHWVVVVSDHMMDQDGQVIGTQGYYIDVTTGAQSDLTAAMASVVKSRAIIEQAKGVLMAAYGIDADRAFGILRWRSRETGVKLKDVAAHIIEALADAGLSGDIARWSIAFCWPMNQRVTRGRDLVA